MARIRLGDTVTSLSGSKSGNTYKADRSGFLSSNRSRKTNRITDRTTRNKRLMTEVSQLWRQLTESQRQQWSELARSGINKKISLKGNITTGFELFKRQAYLNKLSISNFYYAAPTQTQRILPTSLSIAYNRLTDSGTYTIDTGSSANATYVLYYVSKAIRNGYSTKSLTWRFSHQGGTWFSSSDTFVNLYSRAWGSLVPAGYTFQVKICFMYTISSNLQILGPVIIST